MLSSMTATPTDAASDPGSRTRYALALTRFLEAEWKALGTNRGKWCRKVGLADSTVFRWSQGVEPDMPTYDLLAKALGRDLVDVLQAAGYLSAEDLAGRSVAPRGLPDAMDAVRADPALSEEEKQAHLQLHRLFCKAADRAQGQEQAAKPRRARRRPS